MQRLRRAKPDAPGWRRTPRGRGFSYCDAQGRPLSADELVRVKALVIPPAWREVWICPWDNGHLQATGVDAAGRVQYLYHPAWRERRDAEKFDRVLLLGRRLPEARRQMEGHLRAPGLGPGPVLGLAARLLDLGAFRVGSSAYRETYGSVGLTTLDVGHVRSARGCCEFTFIGKSGVEQCLRISDPYAVAKLRSLRRGRPANEPLLVASRGETRVPLTPSMVNDFLADIFRVEVTAKDLRTWKATVTAAIALAQEPPAESERARRGATRAAYGAVAEVLGNTPAVAKTSYVDPRVTQRFEEGRTIAGALRRLPADPRLAEDRVDRAVARLLA